MICKGFLFAKNCLRPEGLSLKIRFVFQAKYNNKNQAYLWEAWFSIHYSQIFPWKKP